MIFQLWEGFFLLILILCMVLGSLKGFLRTLNLLSAHFFSSALALVFSPSLTVLFNQYMEGHLVTHLPSFLLIYLLPMILLTQFFRVLYKRNIVKNGRKISMISHLGGLFTGIVLGSFFCLLFSWLLLLQPLISLERVYTLGGVVFSHAVGILQYFMRFYV